MDFLRRLAEHPEFWKYVSIPFVAAFVGWITNWVAIKMTFLPLRFVGIPPLLGWQGIIPSKAFKMAETFVDTTMSRLGTLPELFEEMEPRVIATHIVRKIKPRMVDYTDDIMIQTNPVLWENLPPLVRDLVYTAVQAELPLLVDALMQDIKDQIEDLLDFKHMISTRLVTDPKLLNRLFQESGEKEFKFIVNSGFSFGFLFGLVQLAVWIVLPAWWVLPLFGLLVGWATNWIAINIIFRPLHPKKVGPWTLQGLFLKRQKEVAAVWCDIVTTEILTIRAIIDGMLNGPRQDRTRPLIRRHIKPLVDEAVAPIRTLAQVAVGPRSFAEIKKSVGDKALHVSMDPFDDRLFNDDRSEVVERLLRERMESLPSEEFQDLLRPCFQEDEWKLILLGAVLGLAAGIAQLVFVFGV